MMDYIRNALLGMIAGSLLGISLIIVKISNILQIIADKFP